MTYQTKFQSDLILGFMATMGPKLKTQKVLLTPEQMMDHPQIFI
jgi:hypothetical protein